MMLHACRRIIRVDTLYVKKDNRWGLSDGGNVGERRGRNIQ